MKQLKKLIDRILLRININLREIGFDARPYIADVIPLDHFTRFYALYGITPFHPLDFGFNHSNIAGSYFLGKCMVDHSVVFKSDIRGDELKKKGDHFQYQDLTIPVFDDETIRIKDSYLIKTLVHCNSHDPEKLEEFLIQNTISTHYANIHGSSMEGCFLGPFSTVDLTTVNDSVVGTFSYLQTGELSHKKIEPGRIWIKSRNDFDFSYRFAPDILDKYIRFSEGKTPKGFFIDFAEKRKNDFNKLYEEVHHKTPASVHKSAALSMYSVFKGESTLKENVLVAQRAYLENAWLGKGANAQENCYIIDSHLEGNNVTAHGARIMHTRMGKKAFAGFNAFLRGKPNAPLTVGKASIIMPHTIVDLEEPVHIPANHVVWGFIQKMKDLETQSLSMEALSRINGDFQLGSMSFKGNGSTFVKAFENRINHILEENGAFFDGRKHKGHAQKDHDISINIIQPYLKGPLKGLYPTIRIGE